jgi:hypothetical protein
MKESNPQDGGERWGKQWTSRSDAALAQERAEQRAASDEEKRRTEGWRNIKPSKAMVAWFTLGAVALTILIGFRWGGWQTADGAAKMATSAASVAVIEQLAPICAAQFALDPDSSAKLLTLQETPSYQQAAFVNEQNWATMPGADGPVPKVADACVRLILQANE